MDVRFYRDDGKPYKIIARGDCTSRRSVYLNKDMFPGGFTFVQNQKSPAIFFLDALHGISVSQERLCALSDVSAMPRSLAKYYVGQAERSILSEKDADLILIDSYADMNFEIWECRNSGEKLWIHPKYISNHEDFFARFVKLGRRTFEQSLSENAQLVDALRTNNPGAQVLFLNQQTDYYPKLDGRKEYYDLGRRLSEVVDNAYFGGVIPKDCLQLDDIGSCGPGLTLHFQSNTYRAMFNNAVASGLGGMCKRFEPAPPVQSSDEPMFAADNPEQCSYPIMDVDVGYGSDLCTAACLDRELHKVQSNLKSYIYIPCVSQAMKWTPAVIDLDDVRDFPKWMTAVNKKYNRRYLLNRSVGKGYVFEEFNSKLFIPDIWEINTSAPVRSGGAMRGAYLKSIEEMGGYPSKMMAPLVPRCNIHWSKTFGVFAPMEGYMQGGVVVDKKLLGYISLRRIGELALYAQVMGNGNYLDDGIMYHLHFKLIEWCASEESALTNGLRFVMYGGVGNGGQSLWQWKNKVGFRPVHLRWRL